MAHSIQNNVPSKDMEPMPKNFLPIFFRNQFLTKIELPTKELYPNVEGKCAIVTGSNTGLGFEASRQLLSLGLSRLIMGVRSLERGETAAKKLRATNPDAVVDVWVLDMASYDSIQNFVRRCESECQVIDNVILNAGIANNKFVKGVTGHELDIQVNHISTSLLALLLLPILKAKSVNRAPPRLTFVNSVTGHLCAFTNREQRPLLSSFDDTTVTPFGAQERYGVSKLVNQLFIVKLAGEIDPDDVIINMVDPGLTKGTSLFTRGEGILVGIVGAIATAIMKIPGRPLDQGAATYVKTTLGYGKESHGCFTMNGNIAPLSHWYYDEGKTLTEVIWSETLAELGFAHVKDILTSMNK